MRPFTATAFSHFIILTTTFASPISALIAAISPSQPFDCQYLSHTYGTYIYFTSPNNTDFSFSIHTNWEKYYPTALRAALVLAGFHLADAPRESDQAAMCGWRVLDSVTIRGWHRGDLTAKPKTSLPTTGILTISKNYAPANPPSSSPSSSSIPPRHEPNEETTTRIHTILLTNYPGADIALFLLELASTVIWAITMTLSLIYLISCLIRRAELRKVRSLDRSIPLQQQRQQAERCVNEGEEAGIEMITFRRCKSEAWVSGGRRMGIGSLSLPEPCLALRSAECGRGGAVMERREMETSSLGGVTLTDV